MPEETTYLFCTRSLCTANDAQPRGTGVMEGPGEVFKRWSSTSTARTVVIIMSPVGTMWKRHFHLLQSL